MRISSIIFTALIATSLVGCNGGHLRPRMTSVDEGLHHAAMQPPIATPVAIPAPTKPAHGSLWQPGSKQFFKDSRAHKVGDIVTVLVQEQAEAAVEGNTDITRTHDSESGLTNLLNLEGKLRERGIPLVGSNLLDTDSSRNFSGAADTDRQDSISANIAAVVVQVLPNDYLVIQGSREVTVNYEVQRLQIQGIVRPEDIGSNNTIASNKIAEARIYYAGKGLVDEAQTPQYGVRFIDKVLPF